jgi:hypothetical protein
MERLEERAAEKVAGALERAADASFAAVGARASS